MAIDEAGGMNTEQILKRGRVKVMIAVDGDFFNAAARTKLDGIENVDAIATTWSIAAWLISAWPFACRRWGLVIDLDIEVTLALKEVAQAAVAFVQQIF